MLLRLLILLTLIYFNFVQAAPNVPYCVVKSYPHDDHAFTQGLLFHDNQLYESTGLYGQSSLRRVGLETGLVKQKRPLPQVYFGEGLVLWNKQLIQLTWREKTAVVYDMRSFKPLRTFTYPTEGWGLTHDGRFLIMSDGSDKLYFYLPNSFTLGKTLLVQDEDKLISKLNELEYVEGSILANIFQQPYIARISPKTGKVLNWLTFPEEITQHHKRRTGNVLNGIAYSPQQKRLFITGKRWSTLFEVAPCVN